MAGRNDRYIIVDDWDEITPPGRGKKYILLHGHTAKGGTAVVIRVYYGRGGQLPELWQGREVLIENVSRSDRGDYFLGYWPRRQPEEGSSSSGNHRAGSRQPMSYTNSGNTANTASPARKMTSAAWIGAYKAIYSELLETIGDPQATVHATNSYMVAVSRGEVELPKPAASEERPELPPEAFEDEPPPPPPVEGDEVPF